MVVSISIDLIVLVLQVLGNASLHYFTTATTPDWDAIAKHFPGKAPIDCLTQWSNISLPDQVKGKGSWTRTEDQILREKRAVYGKKWNTIAEYLPGRSGKQCRERYVNHLNPNLKRGEWTGKNYCCCIFVLIQL
jgi:hypothetical protein